MKSIFGLLLTIVWPVVLVAQTESPLRSPPLVFTHVTVIDATGAPANPDMTVIIAGDRIAALGRTREMQVPKDAQVVHASDKFLIPGLWDMHVHLDHKELFLPLLIANGVTGVRNMGSPPELFEHIKQWREEVAAGKLIGPRIVAPGPILDGPQPGFPHMSIAVSNANEARQAVEALKRQGADFIKVWSLLPRDAYFAIAAEAKQLNMPFAGHVPESVSVAEASDAGQHSMEHLIDILQSCSRDEAELMRERSKLVTRSDMARVALLRELIWPSAEKLISTYSKTKAADLFTKLVQGGNWQVPTLIVFRGWSYVEESLANDGWLKYLPATWKEAFRPRNNFAFKDLTAAEYAAVIRNAKALFHRNLELAGDMRRAGVKFMAGTDTSEWSSVPITPGFSLHAELALLVKAGFTPMEALQTATRNPAEYLGKLDALGTIEKGKMADLVLLDANPLEDISNTRRIQAVVVNGRYLPKETLQKMLADVETAASQQ